MGSAVKTQAKQRWVYDFSQGSASMKDRLGGKGANLAEMTRIGLPVPPGFTVTTQACIAYQEAGGLPEGCWDQVVAGIKGLEEQTRLGFGDAANPLLVSVRSGAPVSMPGMMDTILNLGINDETVLGLASHSKDQRFAYDSYRRFIAMYADIVMGVPMATFEAVLERVRTQHKAEREIDLPVDALRGIVQEFQQIVKEKAGEDFPQDPHQQLELAILAVFRSWQNPRAITYRRLNAITHEMGTAVNVQAMVFGNMGEDSASGVAFTRDPSTGEKKFYGEFLTNSQGEDVVAGIRTPRPVAELKATIAEAFDELVRVSKVLEQHFHDMQDLEFTIMKGKLYMLQTRAGKRTGFAAVRIALDFLDEKLVDEEGAVRLVQPDHLNHLLRPIFEPGEKRKAVKEGRVLAKGLNAGPGGASGRVVFTADEAVQWKSRGEKVILVRHETSPEDIHGMHASEGFLTSRGGMTSHAALVARQMGRTCVAGCGAVNVDYSRKQFTVGQHLVREGDWVSLDGFTGEVIKGKLTTHPSEVVQVLVEKTQKPADAPVYQGFERLLTLADKIRRLGVRANADQPDQASAAVALGAQGIGLCRTEHMFFGSGKIEHMRAMILADSTDVRAKALEQLLPIQRKDFEGIFEAMGNRPVTIRLLDPPLHEFLPHEKLEQRALAKQLGMSFDAVRKRIQQLSETNPMLGHRGCRLGITTPEITRMQARAILEAACAVKKRGVDAQPEIMVPIVSFASEFEDQERIVREVASAVFKERGVEVDYLVGTMIELPRAALTANEIATRAEFFSFGTNDLTQTTLGVSRDDAGAFLTQYQEKGLLDSDPFASIDQTGVGELVRIGTARGRETRPQLKVGICGEHGGDPASVKFFHRVGLDYVSCSPYRLPIARLAAAHAVLEERAAERNGASG